MITRHRAAVKSWFTGHTLKAYGSSEHGLLDSTAGYVHFVCLTVEAGMSRTSSVNMPELIS